MNEFLYSLLPIVGVALIMTGLFLRYRKRTQRRKQAKAQTSDDPPQLRLRYDGVEREQRLKRELDEVAVELHDMTRRNAAILDQKTAMLEKAIRDADSRNEELKKTLKRFEESL